MVASLVKAVERKNPVGKTLTSNNVILLAGLFEHINNHEGVCDSIWIIGIKKAKSAIDNQTQWA
jgi:hypothetical protein